MATSLRVPVATLIESAERRRAQLLADHAAALAAWRESGRTEADVREDLAAALEALAAKLLSGRVKVKTSGHYNRATGNYDRYEAAVSVVVAGVPPKPAQPAQQLAKVDRDLRLLRATSQETISVRSDSDFATYLA